MVYEACDFESCTMSYLHKYKKIKVLLLLAEDV